MSTKSTIEATLSGTITNAPRTVTTNWVTIKLSKTTRDKAVAMDINPAHVQRLVQGSDHVSVFIHDDGFHCFDKTLEELRKELGHSATVS